VDIKALVIDFDGTIVTVDSIDMFADLVGKKDESYNLNQQFYQGKLPGLAGLIQRINFLQGLSVSRIRAKVAEDDHLQKGARELFQFLKQHKITSIIASGSVVPILDVYRQKLGADYVVGSKPIVANDYIVSISEKEYSGTDFKVRDVRAILEALDIPLSTVVAIGDSPADLGIFKLAAKRIAFNPQAGIEQHAHYTVRDDLSQAIPILEELMKQ
jgi:HAD superfamily phosphoserine phosphatase-like hydrolase